MKTAPLPKQLDLRGLAARGAKVAGTVASEDLPRLAEAGIRLVAPAQVTLQLSKDRSSGHQLQIAALPPANELCHRALHATLSRVLQALLLRHGLQKWWAILDLNQ